MTRPNLLPLGFVDSGINAQTPDSDVKYLRFLNATLLLFTLAQLPVLALLTVVELWDQLFINLAAIGLCWTGFLLNRQGRHLAAKVLVLTVLTANTAYFSVILGSTAPTHLWLVPMAVLGILVFKPSERAYTALAVGFSMINLAILELVYRDLTPMVRPFDDPSQAHWAATGSTVSAMLLTLMLVGMMHKRFAQSETALGEEKVQSERLLRAILPEDIAHQLSTTGKTPAIRHNDVSILFADIVGFTPLAASMSAEDIVALLADIFSRIDQLIASCGVEKIKTIGDAYMVASGVPQPIPDHAERLARCAFGMLEIIAQVSADRNLSLQMRVGIHRGSAVAGVIGTTKFAYDMWGESVNLASRLESTSEAGRIHVSDDFRAGLQDTMQFEERGEITLKGVGPTRTHWLVSRHPQDS